MLLASHSKHRAPLCRRRNATKLPLVATILLAVAIFTVVAFAGDPVAPPQSSPMPAAQPTPAGGARAQAANVEDTPAEITPEQREFGERMVTALQKKDREAIKKLVAPKSLACFDHDAQASLTDNKNDKQPFLKVWINKHFRYPIPEQHRLSVSKISPDAPEGSKYATYPVAPTYVLAIEFDTGGGGSITLNRLIGQQDGKWYEVAPCPTQLGMDRFNKIKPGSNVSADDRAKQAYAQVKEPLASQIRALLAKNDFANAWKLCAGSLHLDIGTARRVVAMIASDQPH